MVQDSTDDKSTLVQVMAYGLVPSGNKPLPEFHNVVPDLCCHLASLGHNELPVIQGGLAKVTLILKALYFLIHFMIHNKSIITKKELRCFSWDEIIAKCHQAITWNVETHLQWHTLSIFHCVLWLKSHILFEITFRCVPSSFMISLHWLRDSSLMLHVLTLNMRGPSYLGLTRSISWLLMPWLITSPGHQQPWYWLSRICRSFLRKDFKYLCQINVVEWHKMQIYVYVTCDKFST